MKLSFLTVVFALVVPLAACNTSSRSGSSPATNSISTPAVPSTTSPSPTTATRPNLPASPSPSAVARPSSSSPAAVASPASPSPSAATRPSSPLAVKPSASPSPSAATRPSSPTAAKSPASPSPAIATSPNPGAISNWYSYYSNEGNFTAKFPEKPEEHKNYTRSPQGVISGIEVRYIDKTNQRFYQTGYVDLPVPPGSDRSHFNVEKGLDGGRNGIVKGMGATINSETKITQGGSPGREITMTLENGVVAKARIFINPKNLKAYQAIVATPDGKLDFPEAKAFLDSVKISQ